MAANDTITSTIPSESLDDDTTGLASWLRMTMLDIQPVVPASIEGIRVKNGLPYYQVKPLLYDIDSKGQTRTNETPYNVPMTFIGNSNIFIDNEYKKGDKVILAVCSRDIANIKYNWQQGAPQGDLLFELNGSIIVGLLLAKKPENYISLTEDDVLTIRVLKKILFNTDGELNAQAKNIIQKASDSFNLEATNIATIKSAKFEAKADTINLGNGVLMGVLLQGSNMSLSPTSTFVLTNQQTGVTATFTVSSGTIQFISGGSSSLKGSA